MNPIYWLTSGIAAVIYKIFYKIRIYGTEHLPKGSAILAANHSSHLDPPLVALSSPEEISFMARKSLFRNALFGWWISKCGAFPVDTGGNDLAAIRTTCQLLKEGHKVLIFPEGARSLDGQLKPIKRGVALIATRAECPIVPIYIHGTFEAFSPHHKYPQAFKSMACVFGSPLPYAPFKKLPKKERQEALCVAIETRLKELQSWYEGGAEGSPP